VASRSAPGAVPAYPLDFGSIRSYIEFRFTLLDAYVDVSGIPTFIVAQQHIRDKFPELLHDLANYDLTARVRKISDKLVVSVFPRPKQSSPRKIINVLLFLATIGTVSVASYSLVFGMNPDLMRMLYTGADLRTQVLALAISILAIVGVHEMGHIMAARYHKMDATLPYFVPAPPPFPFGTFGAVISLRSSPANRDQLFDIGFSGPIAGFLATVAVGVLMLVTAPIITREQAQALMASKLLAEASWPNVPLLVELLDWAGLRAVPYGHVLVLANVFFAVQVGALITFLNVLPVWQLDGGHISRAAFGRGGHKLAALIGFGILFLAGYWGFAVLLLVFMFSSRRPFEGVEPLDDVSPLSDSRKALFLLTLVMLVLSFVIF